MIINFDSFKEGVNENIIYKEDKETFKKFNFSKIITSINKVEGTINFNKLNDILIINFDLNSSLTVVSSYSLEEFDMNLPLKDTLYLTNKKENENDEIILVNQSFALEEIIYSLLVTEVPINVHKEGEIIETNEEFHIYSEEELENEKEKEHDSPFDILKDLDL